MMITMIRSIGFSKTKATFERFFDKMMPEPNSGCWLWIGGLYDGRYGKFSVDGKQKRAHRVSYMLFKGIIPPHLCVLHKCDVPCCVNPSHLFLGTLDDNNQDRNRKGRTSRASRHVGAENPNSKLTKDQVLAIRARYKSGSISQRLLGLEYGVCPSAIHYVVNKGWN